MAKNLVWYGPPYSYSGYATHNRCMLFELHKLGWNIRLIPTEAHVPDHLIGKDLLRKFCNNTRIDPKDSICINLIPPPALPMWGKYTVLFTTLESNTVHPGYMRRCLQFDEVWNPCKSNIKSMKRAGYPKKQLKYCPEGVYTEFWNPTATPLKEYQSHEFTFFYNGDWSFRKGVDVLISAFCKEFMPTENVRLLLLTHYQGCNSEKSNLRIQKEFNEFLHKHNISRTPHVQFINDFIPDPVMPNLYNCSNVFVFPTRGEAWGLPAIQAMSCGKPVITTNWGGQLDFCNKKHSFLVNVDKFDIMDDKTILNVDFYRDQTFAFPNMSHLRKLMRDCFTRRTEVFEKGKKSRQFCLAKCWSCC